MSKLIKVLIPIILIITVSWSGVANFIYPEVIEKIYAVVNGELITLSELRNAEIEMGRVLQQQYSGSELEKAFAEMKKGLLNRLVEQKLLLSVAKEKNYDVEHEMEIIIKDIKKQYNLRSDEELKQAILSQGIDYNEWRKQLKETSMQHRLIREEIGYKINIDNAGIMAYYRSHIEDYTKPLELALNCIYLDKAQHLDTTILSEKKQAINAELSDSSSNFEEVAKKYSQLPGSENNYFLGRFKKGELDEKIESAAIKLKKGERSSWVETDTGWYILQLVERKEPELIEYKMVRSEIENLLRAKEQEAKLTVYIDQLKKNSHIKIYEEYK